MSVMTAEPAMDEAAYRDKVRAWLEINAAEYAAPPAEPWSEAELVARSKAWARRKAEAGYGAITAPGDVGGGGGSQREASIFAREEARYHTPTFTGMGIALGMALPVIRRHGTPEQYRRFAAPTIRGDYAWCQLFSEPAAGSDLAGIRTRAVRQGDNWIVNGQKVWSSWAHHADWGILVARSDPTVVKHKGLTFFVVDMRSPGIEVRPIRQITGKSDFNETFLTDVVIPDANRIGAEGEGWACCMSVLMNERQSSGGGAPSGGAALELIRRARAALRESGTALDSAAVRAKIAQWHVEEQGLKNYGLRVQATTAQNEPPPPAVAMMKLVSATKMQQVNAFLMDLGEFGGLFSEPDSPEQEEVFYDYTWSAALRIAGGADEVLRNQLAERVLGMPSDMRADKDVPFDKLPG
jgi:alkylation response protein AidB-like acyl-CoA dehydrogenase